MTFPKEYPLLPPKVKLIGQVFHPNGSVLVNRIKKEKKKRRTRDFDKERRIGEEGEEGEEGSRSFGMMAKGIMQFLSEGANWTKEKKAA